MRAVGIILAGGGSNRMRELAKKRAVCAMPIAGFYRSVDFALSSMSNSHISTVAVFTQYHAGSLNEHLSSSKWWDFGRKQGGLFTFTPAITAENGFWYRGTADAIAQNLKFLKDCHEPYVVITSGDLVYKMDFNKVLAYHESKGADITVVCKDVPDTVDAGRFGSIRMNEEMRIEEFEEKPLVARSNTISCGIYVIRRRLLIELIEMSEAEGRYDFVRDILIRYRGNKRIFGYKTVDYWSNIASVDDYFATNMDFLKPEIRKYFFGTHPYVYTKVEDQPPAKYNSMARVTDSLISSGSIVNGTVEDSVIFKGTFIGNNCYIKNSILLNDIYVGDNTYIENCIVESHSTLQANSYYKGDDGVRIIVENTERFVL